MSLKFKISSLGPIKDSEIDFKPMLIFSGPSNLGKSYTAFLVYYVMKHISEAELIPFIEKNFINEIKKIKAGKETSILINSEIFNKWLNENVKDYMTYLLKSDNINFEGEIITEFEDIELVFNIFEEEIGTKKVYILSEKNQKLQYYIKSLDTLTYFIYNVISENLSINILGTKAKQTLLLPPSKSALINFPSVSEEPFGLGMYKEFLRDYQIIRETNRTNASKHIPKRLHLNIISFMEKILGGKITEINHEIFFSFADTKIPISAAASSIKELTPFLTAINKYHPNSLSVLFEEPESHLHPMLQIELTKIIALLYNYECYFQITTHSDLFITQINNLIRLNNLKKTDKKSYDKFLKTFNFLDKHAISFEKIGAYLFVKGKDGFTSITKQNIESGISLDSFDDAISKLYEQSTFLDKHLRLS